MTHTPGPWFISEDGLVCAPDREDYNGTPWEIARPLEYCGTSHGPDYDTPANALLIAAAPELLEALQWAVDEFDGNTRCNAEQTQNCIQKCRDALNKARGQ